MKQLIASTGAQKGIVGVKRKYEERLSGLKSAITGTKISLHLLGDFYPTGDEYVLVYETTKRLIPPSRQDLMKPQEPPVWWINQERVEEHMIAK